MSLYSKHSQTFCCIISYQNRPYFIEKTSILTLVMTQNKTHVTVLQTLPNCLLYHMMAKSTLSRRENVNFDTSDEIKHNSCHGTVNTPKLLYHIILKSTLTQRENIDVDTRADTEHNSCHCTANTPKLFAVSYHAKFDLILARKRQF